MLYLFYLTGFEYASVSGKNIKLQYSGRIMLAIMLAPLVLHAPSCTKGLGTQVVQISNEFSYKIR